MNFTEVVIECVKTPGFVKGFNRLTGSKLGTDTRAPIEKMIDSATGYKPETEDMRKFVAFVFETVWMRMPLINQDKDKEKVI